MKNTKTMMKRQMLVCLLAVCFYCTAGAQRRMHGHETLDPMVHDPVMIKEGDTFYLYYTGWGVGAMTTTDLKTWRFENNVFPEPPQWAMDTVPGYRGHTWAPDIIYHNGNYHLFYSCSTFGKNTSAIGHAVRSTLAPNDSLPWTDTGMVLRSAPGDNYNAIDPNVVIDENNVPWMSFGSFWGGIQLVQLTDDLTGIAPGASVRTICNRLADGAANADNRRSNAVEAPFIFRHGDYYYLFVSFDYCCRGLRSNYKVVVGRSGHVAGPYLDREGRDMASGGGTLLIASDSRHVAVGHSAVCHTDDADYFLAHGYSRERNGRSLLVIRRMEWDDEGWPLLCE